MAVIGNIRKRSGLLVAIVGIALAAFVLGDFFTGERRSVPDVGKIAGESITYREFDFKVEEYLNMIRDQVGERQLTNEEIYEFRRETWQNMVREILLNSELSSIGLTVTNDELFELVQGSNPHPFIRQSFTDPQTGAFNPQTVRQFLQTLDQREPELRRQWFQLEQSILEDRTNQKYQTLIKNAYYVPGLFAERDFVYRNRAVDVNYLTLSYLSIPDEEVTVGRREIQRAYDKHKHEFYQSEPSRAIEFVVFDIIPSAQDRQAHESEMLNIYEEFKNIESEEVPYFVNMNSDARYDSSFFKIDALPLLFDTLVFNVPVGTTVGPFMENDIYYLARLMDKQERPDSVRASHILISHNTAFNAPEDIDRTEEEAESKADSILNIVSRNPEVFTQLAIDLSDDPSVVENNGDLDWFADGSMIHSFNEACFTGFKGQMKVVESDFGFHVIHITDMLEPVEKVKVAIIERELVPSSETYQNVYAEASSFYAGIKTAEDFDEAVIETGKTKRTADDIKPMDNSIPGLTSPREIVRWAYADDTKLNSVSRIFEIDDRFIIAILKDKREKGIPPLEIIREDIKALAIQHQKAEILTERINAAKASAQTLQEIASQLEVNVNQSQNIKMSSFSATGIGPELKVIGAAMALEEGVISKPIKGNTGVFLISVSAVYDPPVVADYESSVIMLKNHFIQRVSFGLNSALEQVYEVVDNRHIFY